MRVLLACAVALYVGWSVVYVVRTSFEVEDERVFSLWDDGMVSMQYARNLREGRGLRWMEGGERTLGFVNYGPTLLMAALHLVPLAPERAALPFQLLNVAVLAGILVLVWRLARALHPDDDRVAIGALGATLLTGTLPIWSLQGADPGFVAIWILLCALLLHGRAAANAWPVAFYAVLGLAFAIRPDVAPIALVLLAAATLGTRGAARKGITGVGAVLLPAGVVLAASALYFGDPLPLPFYNKLTGSPRSEIWASAIAQARWWLPVLSPLLLLSAASCVLRRKREILQLGAIVLFALVYDFQVGGDWNAEWGSRFVVATAPVVSILAASGLFELQRRFAPHWLRSGASGLASYLAALLVLAVLANPTRARDEWLQAGSDTMLRSYNVRNYERALYFRTQTAPDTLLALHWAGVPAYFSDRPAIDVLGKTNEHIAKLEVDRFVAAHSKWDWDYLMEMGPDVFVTVSRGLADREDFRRRYYRVRYGQGPLRGTYFFLAKGSLAKLRDGDALVVDQESREGTLRRNLAPAL